MFRPMLGSSSGPMIGWSSSRCTRVTGVSSVEWESPAARPGVARSGVGWPSIGLPRPARDPRWEIP